MPPRTLLSLLSKGKYETSEDLPTMPEMAHSYIDNIIESYEESKQYEPEVKGTGLGMLEWAAAPLVGKAGKAYGSTRSALDKLLSKYGKKAHSQIRALIDENRAIALDLPERAIPMERAIYRMIRIIEPDVKKRKIIHNAWSAEEWEEFTGVLQKKVLGALNK